MPAQLANESFRADHVRFGNSIGAVVQVLMRSDIPATETFFRDHLRVSPTGQKISAEAKAMGRTPMGELGQPSDIGDAAVFLASDTSKYITGVVLPVDGGNSIGF